MKPSPLQLLDYFLTDLHVSANPKFDINQEVPLRFEDFELAAEATLVPDKNRQWRVFLSLKHQAPAEANVPYRFTADIMGEFLVLNGYPDDGVERLVKTNGPSMLYGILREVIRDATSRGPHSGVILPSTSFYQSGDKTEPTPDPAEEPPRTAPELPLAGG
jgi:preprotein translocase subunit SecB